MKYIISARNWDDDFQKSFGDQNSIHDLSDAQVVEAMLNFGRALIYDSDHRHGKWLNCTFEDGFRYLEFQNDYD